METLSVTRRRLLKGMAATGLLPSAAVADQRAVHNFRLIAIAAKASLVGGQHPDTAVWAFNGTIPGSESLNRKFA